MSRDGIEVSAKHRLVLIVAALLIGVVTIGTYITVHYLYTGRDPHLGEGIPFLSILVGMIAFPFLLMALAGIRNRVAWLLGIGLTVLFWGYFLYDALSSWGNGEGANIGLGLLMLASPLLIAFVSLATASSLEARQGKAPPSYGDTELR